MTHRVPHTVGMMMIAVVASACHSSGWPTTPSVLAGAPLATAGASSGAVPIALGETVSRVLTLRDPPCAGPIGTEAPEPCQRFAISVRASGLLRVRVESPGPAGLTVRVGSVLQWGMAVNAAVTVAANETYEISVALHDGSADQPFQLTTSLDRQ